MVGVTQNSEEGFLDGPNYSDVKDCEQPCYDDRKYSSRWEGLARLRKR
jgi:hypothetical protein